MKIHILYPNDIIRPRHGFIAPAHNQDFGVEQDAERWLLAHPEYLTDNPDEADWQFFSAYFNRFYTNHWGEHSEIIQEEILRLVNRNRPTFTICEYDLMSYYPDLDLCNMIIFTASRRGDRGIDIPLLCSAHEQIPEPTERRWLASFIGKFQTHGIREEMRQALFGRDGIYLAESQNTRTYIELMADSEVALAPRGFGGQTFRFYEAMQFGCVPFLIGDLDTRPFKRWIEWDTCSFYADDAAGISEILFSRSPEAWRYMGEQARRVWADELHYGKWGKYVIRTLETIQELY